jgi:hypothetical protein
MDDDKDVVAPEERLSLVKQEIMSRETTPFLKATSLPPLQQPTRESTPATATIRPVTPLVEPSSQETSSTAPETPVQLKIEEEEIGVSTTVVTPLQDSPGLGQQNSSRRKKRKSRRGRGTVSEPPPVIPANGIGSPPTMRLTHENKQLFDFLQTKSMSTADGDLSHVRIEVNYLREITLRSIALVMLPLRWALHCAAIYLLPLAIAFTFLAFLVYVIFPRYIFSAIPSVLSTTTTIIAFPAKLVLTQTPVLWCAYVGLGCGRSPEGEEVVRNATFATDLEVRNAFTVIHNLNFLNNSSNRLVLDSVCSSTG